MSQTINWRHGFFRLWIIVSVLWLGAVSTFVVFAPSWQEPSSLIDDLPPENPPAAVTSPDLADNNICVYRDVRGVIHFTLCRYMPELYAKRFWRLFPYHPETLEQVTPTEPTEKHVQTVDEFLAQEKQNLWKQRWELITQNLPLAFYPPLLLLLCGVAVSWVIRGFTAR